MEKESALAAERPLIAGVFTNRLKLKMRLECDPTAIYAALLDERYRGTIHKSDLKSHNPYNTYTSPGLPPGPIANPGASAIEAALHPAEQNISTLSPSPPGEATSFPRLWPSMTRPFASTGMQPKPTKPPRKPGKSASWPPG